MKAALCCVTAEEEWDGKRTGGDRSIFRRTGEEKTVCTGRVRPLLNPQVSVLLNKHGDSGRGVGEVTMWFL